MPMKILVVDDEPDLEILIRQRFRRRIREQELDFVFAEDGLDALLRLEEHPDVDIVLSDINMPRMDGLSLLSRIKAMERLLKVVIVSAYGDIQNIRTAMNRGAFDFITKPIDFEDLEVTIEKTQGELDVLRRAFLLQKQFSALQRELEIASRIQLSVLPSTFPPFPDRHDFDLFATMIPAQEVGGDLYDFFLIDEDRLGFVLGDVSGKGIGAAMFMAITRTIMRATALRCDSPAECVSHVNRVLHPETMPQLFVTLFYGILDTKTGLVRYVNAGHHPPFVLRASGGVELLERTGGLGLCLRRDFDYGEKEVHLAPGDGLLLYTDGVTEAVDERGAEFGVERIAACLQESGPRMPAETIRAVLRAVESFSGGGAQGDDITLLSLKYAGAAAG